MSVRTKVRIQIQDTWGRWKEVEGFYPTDWICAHPDCNKITKTRQRRATRNKLYRERVGTHCSKSCRVKHEWLLKKQEAKFNA